MKYIYKLIVFMTITGLAIAAAIIYAITLLVRKVLTK